jgi:hypothetical protein
MLINSGIGTKTPPVKSGVFCLCYGIQIPQVAQIIILITNQSIKPIVPKVARLYLNLFNQFINFSILIPFFENHIESVNDSGEKSKKGQQ